MLRYFRWSLALHAALLIALLVWTFAASSRQKRTMELVILPKGTSLDAQMTREVADAINNPETPVADEATPSPTPPPTPTPPPDPDDEMVMPPLATPTPIKLATPTPEVTPAPTAVPEKTMTVPPKASPTPTQKPKPTPSPKPKKTATPKPKASPTKRKSTPKPPASVYDMPANSTDNPLAGANLPRQTPANATVKEAAHGQEVGVPGVAEGVEGAPLPLDRNQSGLSMLYATRARMRIQTNFTVPPGVDDPNMTCVVEWEILPDGTIQNARVVKSTGVAQYDGCAIDALNKAGNLGALPPEFGGKPIWTSLTFVYAGNQAP